jgi:hypothetical protein
VVVRAMVARMAVSFMVVSLVAYPQGRAAKKTGVKSAALGDMDCGEVLDARPRLSCLAASFTPWSGEGYHSVVDMAASSAAMRRSRDSVHASIAGWS